jgi:hypothetical protein
MLYMYSFRITYIWLVQYVLNTWRRKITIAILKHIAIYEHCYISETILIVQSKTALQLSAFSNYN